VTPFQANVPVIVSGVGVMPGNYVLADSSGAVVIPDQQLDEALDGARRIAAEDERFRAEIAREDLSRSPERRGGER
jgi:regulator of RNase E activity RraA